MSFGYLDTSAIVKRYFPETGSAWVQALTDLAAGNDILLSEVTLVETAAAFAAKQRAPGGITLAERDGALNRFLAHCDGEYTLLRVASKRWSDRRRTAGKGANTYHLQSTPMIPKKCKRLAEVDFLIVERSSFRG